MEELLPVRIILSTLSLGGAWCLSELFLVLPTLSRRLPETSPSVWYKYGSTSVLPQNFGAVEKECYQTTSDSFVLPPINAVKKDDDQHRVLAHCFSRA